MSAYSVLLSQDEQRSRSAATQPFLSSRIGNVFSASFGAAVVDSIEFCAILLVIVNEEVVDLFEHSGIAIFDTLQVRLRVAAIATAVTPSFRVNLPFFFCSPRSRRSQDFLSKK